MVHPIILFHIHKHNFVNILMNQYLLLDRQFISYMCFKFKTAMLLFQEKMCSTAGAVIFGL